MPNVHLMDFVGRRFRLARASVLTCIGHMKDEMYFLSPMHQHPYEIELMYIISGEGKVTVDGQVYPIRPGDVAVYPMGALHQEDWRACHTAVEFYHLKLNQLKLSDFPEMQLLPEGALPVFSMGDAGGLIRICFEQIYAECALKAIGFEQISHHLLETVVLLVLRRLNDEYGMVKGTGVKSVPTCLKEYIDRNFSTQVVFRQVAEQLYVNYFYLSHAFMNEMGLSPQGYLIQKRIHEAQRLLNNSESAIRDIAFQVGYNNPSHFASQFKRLTGIAPSDYRRRQREQYAHSK